MVIFNSYVSHNQRVNLHFPMVFLWFSYVFFRFSRLKSWRSWDDFFNDPGAVASRETHAIGPLAANGE